MVKVYYIPMIKGGTLLDYDRNLGLFFSNVIPHVHKVGKAARPLDDEGGCASY